MYKKDGALQAAVKLMTFSQLDTFLRGMAANATLTFYTAVSQRLYEIALYDNHVPKEHRKAAIEWLDTIQWIVEANLKETPDALAAFRKGNAVLEDGAKVMGIGTLAWLLNENGISNTEEMLTFISNPNYTHLLEGFYRTLTPELADQIRQSVEERKRNVGY